MKFQFSFVSTLIFFIICCSGCLPIMTSRTTHYNNIINDKIFKQNELIKVYPVYDLREMSNKNSPYQKMTRTYPKIAIKYLKQLNCPFELQDSLSSILSKDNIRFDQINNDWIEKGIDKEVSKVIIMVLNESKSSFTFGSKGIANLSLYLVDKNMENTIWVKEVEGKILLLGPVGFFLKRMAQQGAFEAALHNVFESLTEENNDFKNDLKTY